MYSSGKKGPGKEHIIYNNGSANKYKAKIILSKKKQVLVCCQM